MANRDPGLTPYHFVKNNPIMLIDPDGLTWDEAIKDKANKILGYITNVRDGLKEDNTTYQAKIDKYKNKESWSSSKKQRKISKKQRKIDRNKLRISGLDKSIKDFEDIDGASQVYTLKQISGSTGETYIEDGMVVMEYSSSAMAAHEIRHGGQNARNELIITGKGMSPLFYGGVGKLNDLTMEIDGYRAQFGFDPGSMPVGTNGGAYYMGSINRKYLQGLYSNGKRLYPNL